MYKKLVISTIVHYKANLLNEDLFLSVRMTRLVLNSM